MMHTPEEMDRNWDKVLRRVGPHLELPAEPDASRRKAWKSPRRSWLGRHRIVTLCTGSGAVAAGFVLAVLMLLGPRQVNARTIFADLRSALSRSMRLSFEDVEIDLARLRPDLHGHLRCAGSVVASDQEDPRAFADVDISLATASADVDFPSMDLQLLTAAVPQAEWAYLRLDQIGVIEGGLDPRIALVAEIVRQGVYLELSDFLGTRAGRRVGSLPAFGLGAVFKLRDREGLETLFLLIEHHAAETNVQELDGGEYVLTARGFDLTHAKADGRRVQRAIASVLSEMELRVLYDESQGVRRIEIDHFGHGSGRVVLELGDFEIQEGIVDLERHLQARPGITLNLRALLKVRKWFKRRLAA